MEVIKDDVDDGHNHDNGRNHHRSDPKSPHSFAKSLTFFGSVEFETFQDGIAVVENCRTHSKHQQQNVGHPRIEQDVLAVNKGLREGRIQTML